MLPATNNTELKLTPTLLIGLGGTGKDVILRIRRLFSERFGHANRYPIIGTVVLDTNNINLDDIAGADVPAFIRRQIALSEADDVPSFVHCKLDPNEFRDYFSGGYMTYPHIFRWMPQSMDKWGVTAVTGGAGQHRLFGRLMWFHHYPKIRQALVNHFQKIIKYAAQPELAGNWLPPGAKVDPSKVEVAIVTSLAGGTGCGMFLDTGMLVREILKDFPGASPHITHYIVLPDALTSQKGVPFDSTQKRKVEENAFAALREMEYFALRREGLFDLSIPPLVDDLTVPISQRRPMFEVTWDKNKAPQPITDAPWDTCYLIGSSNDPLRGAPLAYHDVYQMISEHLFLDFDPSNFGEMKRTTRSNLVQQTMEVMRDPVKDENGIELYSRFVSRRFSTLGLSQLQFDRDRMRRAAAHRLARLLVERWWMRSNNLRPTDLAQRAEEDLGPEPRGEKEVDDVVTRTGKEADRWEIPRLGIPALARRLTRTGSAGSGDTWVGRVNNEYKDKRAALQDEAFDPLSADPLSGWVNEHQERLTAPAVGAPPTGDRGFARRDFEENQRQLLPDIGTRLSQLFHYRLETLGLADTLALIAEYDQLNRRRVKAADQIRSRGAVSAGAWPGRVAEARRLPLYARRVTRLELLRAVQGAWAQITAGYQLGIAEHLASCYQLVDKRVGQTQPEGSYHVSLHSYLTQLEQVRNFLHARFTELSENESGRRDTSGRPDEAAAKTGRVTALLERQTADEYDRRILQAMGWSSLDPRESGVEARWRDLERRVLAELARSTDRRLQNVESVADLILRYFPIERRDPPVAREIETLARELARACEAALPAFAGDITALREYLRDSRPEQLLNYLRIYSAPYLRKDNSVTIAREVDIPPMQLLGLAGYDTSDGKRFIDALRDSGQSDPLPLVGLQALDMKDDAIVLYREKAGIPLAYYADLEHLGKQYDSSSRKLELHLDHSYMNGRLPEIRRIDQNKQTTLANCLKLVLLGITTGRVKFERMRNSDRDQRRSRETEHEQITFSYLFRGINRPLGQQLDEVVRRLADNEQVDMRNDLSREVAKWLTDHAGKDKGLGVACLWAAMKSFCEEIRERVDRLVNRNPDGGERIVDHPLQAYLTNHVIPFIQNRLDGIPGGNGWISCLRDWETVLAGRDSSSSELAEARALWDAYVAPAFTRINETDLPIPVLRLPNTRFAGVGEAT
ncbi:MAG: tubulin-like doman-containing protein [Planctomycetes bacterium]|nr:tubulin-like doman-containing protein [Planctomycetota bacterium]